MLAETSLHHDIDAVAVKPAESELTTVLDLDIDRVIVDYEGNEHIPAAATLAVVADSHDLFVTTPVRVDGYDPLGDDRLLADLPANTTRVLVAGNPAYLTDQELQRAIAPRLKAARKQAPNAWVGTEGIEPLARSIGGTQFEILGPSTATDVRQLRDSGFDGDIAVYAPTVLTTDPDGVLDAIGRYIARRDPVRAAIPEATPVHAAASGRVRETLLKAAPDYALVGDIDTIQRRITTLRDAGVSHIVAYPATGPESQQSP